MTELINVSIYDHTGIPDSGLMPVIDIYNTTDSTMDVTGGLLIYDSLIKRYQYVFTTYNPEKEYICNVDCGVSALTRYLSFGIGAGLLPHQANELANTVKRNSIILNLGDISIPI